MIPLINPDSSEVAVSYNLPRIIYIHIYIYQPQPTAGGAQRQNYKKLARWCRFNKHCQSLLSEASSFLQGGAPQ